MHFSYSMVGWSGLYFHQSYLYWFLFVSAILSTTDTKCSGLGVKLCFSGYRPVNNCMIHTTVCYTVLVCDVF
jgi:hypothetical protein